ncbi:hypothetical protein Ahy_B07g088762 [Arachis hypogaea]|uniref:Uncharacterized protein n=2 Tax=Arachis hypogaea TaxID=3818 RepID=A0A444YFE5_ARAHY|nr:hypothetical protein Ahy_B07g088762 [Arachis hypogaea]
MASAASPRIPTETVKNAVEALLKWRDSNSESHKPKLFDADEEFVYLVVTLKTIPHKSRVNPYKVPLPHSLLSPFNETCLIIDDRSKSKLTKQEAQKKIKADNVAVSKVLKLSKLASDYRPFEAKRKLCDSYDLFFADKRVVPLMPRLLGKKFFKKKKVPVQVDLTKKNWKEQVDKACSSALLFLGTGTCCVVKVAKVSMESEQIVENMMAAIEGVVEVVPKKWANVRSLHVKLYESLALPVFQAVPEVKLRIEGSKVEEAEKEKQTMGEEEEGEDHSGAKAVKKKKKGRIHEVRYMDSEVGEDNVEDVAGSEDDGGGVVMEEDLKDAGKGSGELANKKRKKGALSELSSVKELKKSVKRSGKKDKSAKVMKENSIKKNQNSELSVEDGDSGKKGKNIKKKLSLLKSEEADLKKKVRELAEKESENGIFRLLWSDVTRFLTTILIGTTVVNIAATALVTDAATAMFGEAGVSAATGVMTVAILLLTEITPKSIAVHNATEVARFVVRPVAWLSLVLYPVGRVVTYLSMGMLKMLGLKGRSEPYVTEEELKLMLRGAELSGAIEEEEQDMIENVLEIKDTHVREVMTPLVDVVAIDGSLSLVDFHHLWVTHQYSRVPVFEQRVDNITGIAYAMDLLDYVKKGDLLESTTVGDMAHKPAYFVPDSMSVWNLLREFRIRKVHMAVVLNEYGGTVGIVTLEDVVEEIVGEIFDENDSKEEIQKKTGYIVMRAEGVFDVDANTSIDQLSEDLNIKMPEGHQYETVSGFVCETFGYIPRTGESIKVSLEREDEDDDNEETKSDNQDSKEKNQIFKLEILAGNARKVSAVRFERINGEDEMLEAKEVTHFVPKIVKRKWNNDEDSDDADYDGDAFAKRPQHEISSEYIDDQENSDRN